jgi:hypothetical protein
MQQVWGATELAAAAASVVFGLRRRKNTLPAYNINVLIPIANGYRWWRDNAPCLKKQNFRASDRRKTYKKQ